MGFGVIFLFSDLKPFILWLALVLESYSVMIGCGCVQIVAEPYDLARLDAGCHFLFYNLAISCMVFELIQVVGPCVQSAS